MTATYAGGIGLMLPPETMHTAVVMVLLALATAYGLLFWAIRRAAHDRLGS